MMKPFAQIYPRLTVPTVNAEAYFCKVRSALGTSAFRMRETLASRHGVGDMGGTAPGFRWSFGTGGYYMITSVCSLVEPTGGSCESL